MSTDLNGADSDLHKLGHEVFPVIPVQKLNQTRLILITCKNYHRSIAAINKLPRRQHGWMNLFTLAAYTADMMIWLSCKCIRFRCFKKKKTFSSGTTGSKSKMTVSERDTGLKFGLRRNVNTHASLPTRAKKHARWKFTESLSLIGGVIAACLRDCEIEQKFHSI